MVNAKLDLLPTGLHLPQFSLKNWTLFYKITNQSFCESASHSSNFKEIYFMRQQRAKPLLLKSEIFSEVSLLDLFIYLFLQMTSTCYKMYIIQNFKELFGKSKKCRDNLYLFKVLFTLLLLQ